MTGFKISIARVKKPSAGCKQKEEEETDPLAVQEREGGAIDFGIVELRSCDRNLGKMGRHSPRQTCKK